MCVSLCVCVSSEFGFTNLKIMTSMAKICIVKIRNWKRKSKHEFLHLLVNRDKEKDKKRKI